MKCTSCGKVVGSEQGLNGHLRGKIHTDKESDFYLTPKQRQLLQHEIVNPVIGKGSMSIGNKEAAYLKSLNLANKRILNG